MRIPTLTFLLLSAAPAFAQKIEIDPKIPAYAPVKAVSGNIKSVGSETMNNLMTLWAQGFKRHYPNVSVEVEGKGSSTAPPALIKGAATFGPMSREMKQEEIDEFERAFGYPPTALPTGIDMLAVFVHKDNPIAKSGLSLEQVDAIYSKTRKGGFGKDVRTWGDLGLEGEWASRPISLYGRNSASGTYGFFKERAIFKGDFKDSVKEQPGSSAVVQAVASDRYGIGYSGVGFRTADVVALPLARASGQPVIEPSLENAYSGRYPLSRFLYTYLNHRPGAELDPLRREFVRYIFSRQGQEAVVKDGYYPVPFKIAGNALALIGEKLEPTADPGN
jgi:phosphate transport system substrate-binding protein